MVKKKSVKKTKKVSKRSNVSRKRNQVDFLNELAMFAGLVAMIFSLALVIGYLFNITVPMATTLVPSQQLKTEISPRANSSNGDDSRLHEPGAVVASSNNSPGLSSVTVGAKTTPATGMPEVLIITAAVILGLIGSLTFLTLRKGI